MVGSQICRPTNKATIPKLNMEKSYFRISSIMQHYMRIAGLASVFLTQFAFSKDNNIKHPYFAGLQFGGQMMVALNFEYSLIHTDHFLMNITLGPGINENGDEQTKERALYGIQTGLVSLLGKNSLYIETSLVPTTYIHGPLSFMNINGWAGFRFISTSGGFVSVCYTPLLYSSRSNPHYNFFSPILGVKGGFNF